MAYYEDVPEDGRDLRDAGDGLPPELLAYLRLAAGRRGIMGRGARPGWALSERDPLGLDLPDGQDEPVSALASHPTGPAPQPGPMRPEPPAGAPGAVTGATPGQAANPDAVAPLAPAPFADPAVLARLNQGYRGMMPIEPFLEQAHALGVPKDDQWDVGARNLFFGRDHQAYTADADPFVGPPSKGPTRRGDPAPASSARAPTAPARAGAAGQPEGLGSLSRHYEVGRGGPGTVSPGGGDPGGISYGSFQLATRARTPQAFLRSEGAPWAQAFRGLRPGTPQFDAQWRAVAAAQPEAFDQAQHDFIQRTHYLPAVRGVARQSGLDLDGMSQPVRDAAWSTSVQHGRAVMVLNDAVRAADRIAQRGTPEYDQALIGAIYDRRTAYVREQAATRRRPEERRTLENVARLRYPEERAEALRRLREARRR